MRYLIVLVSLVFLVSCGGGGGGGSSDLSCAPTDLATPTVDLNTAEIGPWTLILTQTSSTCPAPPDSITCTLNMTVTGNDVAISGTCQTDDGVTVTLSGISGKVSASTLYWGGTMSETVGSYTETDTVPCTSVAFISNFESQTFSVTISVAWSDSGESGTCSTTFSGKFQ